MKKLILPLILASVLAFSQGKDSLENKESKLNVIPPVTLRIDYHFGRLSGKNDDKKIIDNVRYNLSKDMELAAFFIEKQNEDSVKYYFNKIGDYLKNGEEGIWLKAERMSFNNISCEYYVELFNKTKKIEYLNLAEEKLKKVFEEYEKNYFPVNGKGYLDIANMIIEEERLISYDNIGLIERLKK